jgi:hypothetical protein
MYLRVQLPCKPHGQLDHVVLFSLRPVSVAARVGAMDRRVRGAALAVSTVAAAIWADLVCLKLDLVHFGCCFSAT